MKTITDLFETPIVSKKVNTTTTAYKYRNGLINIAGQKYIGYSMTEAIKKYKKTVKNTKP